MEYPLRSKLITSLYSAFICSAVFTEPPLRPSFPPFSIYRFLPDSNRNEILSRSNCVQVESEAIIIGAKRDLCPSSSNNVSRSFCMIVLFCITKKNKLQKIREKRFLNLDTTLPTPSSPYSPVPNPALLKYASTAYKGMLSIQSCEAKDNIEHRRPLRP